MPHRIALPYQYILQLKFRFFQGFLGLRMMMPSITVCSFLCVTNGFKLYDQNLALTNGAPSNMSEGLALNITRTFYGRVGWEGVGQAKAVLFFVLVAIVALIQNKLTTSKEVEA